MALVNRAPRWLTIAVAAVLVVVGWLGTFAGVLPEAVGVWSLVAATVLLLLGIAFRGL